MGFSYLGNMNWSDITREERLFCAELYFQYRDRPSQLVEIIRNSWNAGESKGCKTRKNENPPNPEEYWELAYEVCFYRDLLKSQNRTIKDTQFPQKRTFDLCLFSEKQIIIFEAKAKQNFDNIQMKNFDTDRNTLQCLFKEIKPRSNQLPQIYFIGIKSSLYTSHDETLKHFDLMLSWDSIKSLNPGLKGNPFGRADSLYKETLQ